jgi:hypothetical protein
MLTRRQAHPGGEIPTAIESLDRRCQGFQRRRDHRSNARNRHQPPGNIIFPRALADRVRPAWELYKTEPVADTLNL